MHLTVKISFYEQGFLVMCMFAYSIILIIIVIWLTIIMPSEFADTTSQTQYVSKETTKSISNHRFLNLNNQTTINVVSAACFQVLSINIKTPIYAHINFWMALCRVLIEPLSDMFSDLPSNLIPVKKHIIEKVY